MKKILLSISLMALTICASAQVRSPHLSPLSVSKQVIGKSKAIITYSRPQMKGRKIFGGLEEYGKVWRTGANRNSKIQFTHPVLIGKDTVQAGTYAIYTRPTPTDWDVIFYNDTTHWEVAEPYEQSKVVAEVKVPSIKLTRTIQTLFIGFEDITESTANLVIQWENTHVAVPIDFMTNTVMSELSKKELDNAAVDFHIAARYQQRRDLDLAQAKIWMEKAIYLNDEQSYWDWYEYALILYKLDMKKEAIKASKKSLKMAEAKEYKPLIERNTKILKDWGAM